MNESDSNEMTSAAAENNCIWMEAGTVAYKTCDREFNCESCAFDDVMRRRNAPESAPPRSSPRTTGVVGAADDGTASQQLEQQLEKFFQPLFSVELPSDRLYHRSHMWVRRDSESSSTIGIDHIGAYFLQPVVSVVLPQTPSRIELKSPCTWLVLREGTIALRSAVQGIAAESNPILLDHPYLLLDDPYDAGWILKVHHGGAIVNGDDLLTSEEYNSFFRKEANALKGRLAASVRRSQPDVGTTLLDGGAPVRSIPELLGRKKYFELVSRIFAKS